MQRELICISCPMGCHLQVELADGAVLGVKGNRCPRGAAYAQSECLNPVRMVTASVYMGAGKAPVAVRTSRPIPKDKIFQSLAYLQQLHLQAPLSVGDVVVEDLLGTGVQVIVTRDCPA